MLDCIIFSVVSEIENDIYVVQYVELVEIKLLWIEKKIIVLKVKLLIYLFGVYLVIECYIFEKNYIYI